LTAPGDTRDRRKLGELLGRAAVLARGRGFQRPPGMSLEEFWNQQAERAVRELNPDPLYLLRQKHHPLVAGEVRRARRWRTLATVGCVAVPVLYFLFLAYAESRVQIRYSTGWDAVARGMRAGTSFFVCLWPLAMFSGSALTTAMSVIAERTRYTAFQIVLTPARGESIAAAKVLPRPMPFVWGIAAALPIYACAGGWTPLSLEGRALTPLAFWPLRCAALPWWQMPAELSPGGVACGLFMVLADAGLVWAAAHWGACYAAWLGNLPGVVLWLLWRLVYLSVIFFAWCVPGVLCIVPMGGGAPGGFGVMFVLAAGACLLGLLWFFPMRGAVRNVLVEFMRFDRLAGDEFRPGYFKRFRVKIRSEGPPRL
jgi:hypothetical protein